MKEIILNHAYKLKRPLINNILLNSNISNNYYYLSKITKHNFNDKVRKIQKNYLKYYNYINNHNIYKKEKLNVCFISKYMKKNENIKQINIKFLLLTSLFIKKNIQQYGFYLLKKEKKNFEYPFCLKSIFIYIYLHI